MEESIEFLSNDLTPSGFSTEEPTNHLRFIIRDDKKILQQLWNIISYGLRSEAVCQDQDWKDVPLEGE
jgi:hypothetical protein